MTRHIGSCRDLSGAIRKYLGSYEGNKICFLPFAKQTVKVISPFTSHFSRKRTAFTKPSRGTNASESRTITSGNRAFRFDCERCRLTRGAVDRSNRKTAFTLAEVLVTLGIIGVVAALTLPSLINNFRAKEFETRFKKGYSTLNQACQKMIIDEGFIPTKSNITYSEFQELLQKYYVKLTDCQKYKCVGLNITPATKWAGENYKDLNKENNSVSWVIDDGMLMSADGMTIYIDNSETPDRVSYMISIDINGLKKPNIWGYDLFTFILDKNTGRLAPAVVNYFRCDDKLKNVNYNGASCAKRAISESDYFKNLKY